MNDDIRHINIVKISGDAGVKERDPVVRESPITIFLNDAPVATLLCSPKDLEPLAVGFLFSEGLIRGKKDIKRLFGDSKDRAVWVETSGRRPSKNSTPSGRFITAGCGSGLTFTDSAEFKRKIKGRSGPRVSPTIIASLMKEFQKRSRTYKMTGGVHSAGLANACGILVFNDDIGRHNAIDKILGECILTGKKTEDTILMTSGRISSDILFKAARAGIPVIVSRAAPTDLSVKLARELGITIVGFARGSRMNIYSNEWRIVPGPGGR